MKVTELVNFLFDGSQNATEQAELRRDAKDLIEDTQHAEELSVKKSPLKAALKKLGITSDISNDPSGFAMVFNVETEYNAAKEALQDYTSVNELAELGWVALFCGDVAMSSEEPELRIRFLELSTPEAENAEKMTGTKELDAIVKAAREFSFEPEKKQPEPKLVKGGVGKAKSGAVAKKSIKDSKASDLVNRLLE